MIAYTQSIGHDGQRRIDCGAGREEASVYDVNVIELVRLAVHIESRTFRIAPEPDRAVLVGHACQRNPLAGENVARKKALVAVVSVDAAAALLIEKFLQFC